MRKAVLISLMIATQVGIAWAQQPAPQNATPTLAITDQTAEEVQANTDEVSKQPIPDKDTLLLRELDRIDGEIARATQQLQKANSYKNDQSYYSGIVDRITK